MARAVDGVGGGIGREGGAGTGTLPEVLARHTAFLLGKAGQMSREAFDSAIAPLGLKSRHYGAMATLAAEGVHTQRELGEKLQIDRSTMVTLVDDLEGMGLVERRRDQEDRRRYGLILTDAGREVLAEAYSLVEGVQETVLAPLDEGQRRELHGLLASLLRGPDLGTRS